MRTFAAREDSDAGVWGRVVLCGGLAVRLSAGLAALPKLTAERESLTACAQRIVGQLGKLSGDCESPREPTASRSAGWQPALRPRGTKLRLLRDVASLAAVAGADNRNTSKSGMPLAISYADLKDYQARNGVFRSLAGYTSPRVLTRQEGGDSQRIFGEIVTGNYFSTLGLTPARGRFFLPEEDSTPGTHAVAVLNYGTGQTRFGGAEDIVGRNLRANNIVFTVVGVAPPKFIGVNAIFGPDLWIPAAMAERLLPKEMRGR